MLVSNFHHDRDLLHLVRLVGLVDADRVYPEELCPCERTNCSEDVKDILSNTKRSYPCQDFFHQSEGVQQRQTRGLNVEQ